MTRTGISQNSKIYRSTFPDEERKNTIISENLDALTSLCNKIAQEFLDILILKKLERGGMRLCELAKSLNRELFVSIDMKKLYKTIKRLKKIEIVETGKKGNKKIYRLTNKGEKIVETLRKQQHVIHEVVLSVVQ